MKIEKQANVTSAGIPDEKQLEKINAQAKSPLAAEDVYVFSVRLCDDQVDRDDERFTAEALEQLAPMFIGKTGICDHAWSSDKQVARIFDAGVEYAGGAAYLKAWAYILRGEKTAELIREIEGGIKKEVSVGCAMGRRICSICGAEYGCCEHRKGQMYGAQRCTAVLCEPKDAYEFSFVAVPAQRDAGVLKKMKADGWMSPDEVRVLEKQAALGRSYRAELEQEFVTLALMLDMGLSEKALRQMAGALEAEQLRQARSAMRKKAAMTFPMQTQLTGEAEHAQKPDSAFLI